MVSVINLGLATFKLFSETELDQVLKSLFTAIVPANTDILQRIATAYTQLLHKVAFRKAMTYNGDLATLLTEIKPTQLDWLEMYHIELTRSENRCLSQLAHEMAPMKQGEFTMLWECALNSMIRQSRIIRDVILKIPNELIEASEQPDATRHETTIRESIPENDTLTAANDDIDATIVATANDGNAVADTIDNAGGVYVLHDDDDDDDDIFYDASENIDIIMAENQVTPDDAQPETPNISESPSFPLRKRDLDAIDDESDSASDDSIVANKAKIMEDTVPPDDMEIDAIATALGDDDVTDTIDYDIATTGDDDVVGTIDNAVATTGDDDVTDTINYDIATTGDDDVVGTIENAVATTGDNDVSGTIDNAVATTGDDDVTDTIDYDIATTGDDDVVGTIENAVATTGDDDVTDTINYDIATANDGNDVAGTIENAVATTTGDDELADTIDNTATTANDADEVTDTIENAGDIYALHDDAQPETPSISESPSSPSKKRNLDAIDDESDSASDDSKVAKKAKIMEDTVPPDDIEIDGPTVSDSINNQQTPQLSPQLPSPSISPAIHNQGPEAPTVSPTRSPTRTVEEYMESGIPSPYISNRNRYKT
jgi:hypothetical protein